MCNEIYDNNDNVTKIHAQWNQTVVKTGRFSCCRPNLQQIPKEQVIDNIEINFRKVFIPSSNKIFISADYSQIEMRILSIFCKDKAMSSLLNTGKGGDIYKEMASLIFKKQSLLITKNERSIAKTVALGIIYGLGAENLSKQINVTIHESKNISNKFFNEFPQVKKWMEYVKKEAKETGYVTTWLGRRRYLPDINSSDSNKRSAAERQAINSIIQGTCSDIIKYSMIKMEQEINKKYSNLNNNLAPKLLLQIHDELIYEVSTDNDINDKALWMESGKDFANILVNVMENIVAKELNLGVPIFINVSIGSSLGDCVDYEAILAKDIKSQSNISSSISNSNNNNMISSNYTSPNDKEIYTDNYSNFTSPTSSSLSSAHSITFNQNEINISPNLKSLSHPSQQQFESNSPYRLVSSSVSSSILHANINTSPYTTSPSPNERILNPYITSRTTTPAVSIPSIEYESNQYLSLESIQSSIQPTDSQQEYQQHERISNPYLTLEQQSKSKSQTKRFYSLD
jgi:hypothetical protein